MKAEPKLGSAAGKGRESTGAGKARARDDSWLGTVGLADSTVEQYAKLYDRLVRQARREFDLPLADVVQWHVGRRHGLAPASWRLYKAALLWGARREMESMPAQADRRALTLALQQLNAAVVRKASRATANTSAARVKRSHAEEFACIVECLRLRGPSAVFAARWLRAGARYGLRPSEWCHADIVVLDEQGTGWPDAADGGDGWSLAGCGGLGGDGANLAHMVRMARQGRLWLRVANHKSTHGRSHGKHRHLQLRGEDDDLRDLAGFLLEMRGLHARGEYRRMRNRCASRLQEISRRCAAQWAWLLRVRHEAGVPSKYLPDWVGAVLADKQTRRLVPCAWRSSLPVVAGLMQKLGEQYKPGFCLLNREVGQESLAVLVGDGQVPATGFYNLYSARHRFSSTMKALHGPEDVAAMMGHASSATARRHYAPMEKGRKASGRVSPAQWEVAKVRPEAGRANPNPVEGLAPTRAQDAVKGQPRSAPAI